MKILFVTSCDVGKCILTSFKQVLLFMKISVVLSFMLLSLAYPYETNGQNALISLNMKNQTVSDVLEKIEKQSNYFFFYNNKEVDVNRVVSIDVENEQLRDVLNILFGNSKIQYSVLENSIILSNKEIFATALGKIQGITVAGTIRDETGQPMPGVNVLIKETVIGVVTDVNGKYVISVPDKDAVLVFSFIGYKTQEFPVGDQTVIDIELSEETRQLEEIVVVGFGTQKKESLTSAITSVETQYLENRSVPKLSTALQGITPGVNIRQTTGRPGYSATTFDIRGASMGTFSENKALVVIDGIVDDINNVNPEDIEKISILKDAAAAAIYGSRSTGGVVLITTKRGAAGKSTVNYSLNIGTQRFPFNDYKFINTAEWMRANNEGAHLDGSPAIYSDEEIAKYENSTDPQYPVESQWTDWVRKSAMQQTQNLSFSGGNDKLNFYTSVGYVTQNGIIDNDDYKKISMLSNINYKVGSRFDLHTSISYIKEYTTRPAENGFVSIRNSLLNPPKDPFYLPNGDYNNRATLGVNPAYTNREGGNSKYEFNNLRISLGAQFKILEGFFLKYTLATSMNYNIENTQLKKLPLRENDGTIYGYNRSEVYVKEKWDRPVYFRATASIFPTLCYLC